MLTETFDKITLINGDCMDYLRGLPDNAFDLAVVDPPYGDASFQKNSSSNRRGGEARLSRTGGTWATKYKRKSQDTRSDGAVREIQPRITPQYTDKQSTTGIWWDIAPDWEYFQELFRVSKNQIIWGGNYFVLPPCRCFLVWRKLSISESFTMAMAEYAWTSFNANAKVFECAPQGTAKEPRTHPCQKPVALYSWILQNYAKEGDKILDTHMGSGSSAIAAHNLGFDFTGIEIDQEYYNSAKERLIRHQQQLTLF